MSSEIASPTHSFDDFFLEYLRSTYLFALACDALQRAEHAMQAGIVEYDRTIGAIERCEGIRVRAAYLRSTA